MAAERVTDERISEMRGTYVGDDELLSILEELARFRAREGHVELLRCVTQVAYDTARRIAPAREVKDLRLGWLSGVVQDAFGAELVALGAALDAMREHEQANCEECGGSGFARTAQGTGHGDVCGECGGQSATCRCRWCEAAARHKAFEAQRDEELVRLARANVELGQAYVSLRQRMGVVAAPSPLVSEESSRKAAGIARMPSPVRVAPASAQGGEGASPTPADSGPVGFRLGRTGDAADPVCECGHARSEHFDIDDEIGECHHFDHSSDCPCEAFWRAQKLSAQSVQRIELGEQAGREVDARTLVMLRARAIVDAVAVGKRPANEDETEELMDQIGELRAAFDGWDKARGMAGA